MQLQRKILILNASPRIGGNIDIILKKIIQALGNKAQVKTIYLNDLNFRPCQACNGCDKDAICVLDDDLRAVYKQIIEADVIILGSPIFFGSLSAQAKMLIDRMQPFWVAKARLKRKSLKDKKGFLILVAGSGNKTFFENALAITKNFFKVINAKYCGQLFFEHIDKKGEILDFPGLEPEAEKIARATLEP
jgi:multimeric flavodoxin WrbA